MCCNKRRAAAYSAYPPAVDTAGLAPGPYYGRRGCRAGHRRPGLIRMLVTKAIDKRNQKIEARQQQEGALQGPRQSDPYVAEKVGYDVHQERQPVARPVKIVFDDGHEEYVSTPVEKEASGTHVQPQKSGNPPRYSEVMKA